MIPSIEQVRIRGGGISRRGFFKQIGTGVVAGGAVTVGWRDFLVAQATGLRRRGKAMILLWMDGGPSQYETFVPKIGSKYQGPAGAIATNVPGIPVAEYWRETAKVMDKVAVIASMSGGPLDHDQACQYVRTGYDPSSALEFPTFGSVVAWHREDARFDLPAFIRIGNGRSEFPGRNPEAGCLGVQYNPLYVRQPGTLPRHVAPAVVPEVLRRRLALARLLNDEYARAGATDVVRDQQQAYDRAARLALSPRLGAFDLSREPDHLRDDYGRTEFGQGCLLARRLVERGVSFVEVLSADGPEGWDTHRGAGFKNQAKLSRTVDAGYATLLSDLAVRGLLKDTLVVWMGEFGRAPKFEGEGGREHYSKAYCAALAGGGVRGGQVIGATDKDGVEVVDRPVSVQDLMVTYCHLLGMNPRDEYTTSDERPIRLVEGGAPIEELVSAPSSPRKSS